MKCPNCANEMVQSRAGWLCLSCGHVEGKPADQVADAKITLGKDSHAQMANAAKNKPSGDKPSPVGPPPSTATPKLDTISAPEPKADEPPPSIAPPWADDNKPKDATSDKPADDTEKTPDVTQPDDIAAVKEAVKEAAGVTPEVKPGQPTQAEETAKTDDGPTDEEPDEKAPAEETPADKSDDSEPPATPKDNSAEPEESDEPAALETQQKPEEPVEPTEPEDKPEEPEEPTEPEDKPEEPEEPADPELMPEEKTGPAQPDEPDVQSEAEPPANEADTDPAPDENPETVTDPEPTTRQPDADNDTEPDEAADATPDPGPESDTDPVDDNMPGPDVPPPDPEPESGEQAQSDTKPQTGSNPDPQVSTEPETPAETNPPESVPSQEPAPDEALSQIPDPEPALKAKAATATPAADMAPPASPPPGQTPPPESPPPATDSPDPAQTPPPPPNGKPPLTAETHPKKKRKFHLFSVSLVAGLAIGASGLAIFASTVGPKLALASYASRISGAKTMAFAASVNNVSAGYQFALKLNGTTDLRQATQPKLAATVSGNVAQAGASADLPIGGQLTANLITAGQQLFFKLTSLSLHSQVVGLAPSAKWYGLDLGGSPGAKCLSQGTSSDSLLSSNGLSAIPVSSASLVGLSQLNGALALHYRGTLDPSKLTGGNLSADCQSMLASLKTSHLTYDLWRGWSQDRLTLAVAGGSTITLDTSAYNRPVAIAVPSGAQSAADLFSNVLGASTVAPGVAKAAAPAPAPTPANQTQTVKNDLVAYLAAYRAQAKNGFFPTNPPAVTPAGITGSYTVVTAKPSAPGQLYYQAGGVCAAPAHTPGRTATRYLALTALAADGTSVCLDSTHN